MLVDGIRRGRGEVRTIVEQSLVGESASYGTVEISIQTLKGMLRTIKGGLEARWNIAIPDEHPASP